MSLWQTSLVQVLGKGQGITPPMLLIQYSGILKTRIPPAYIVLMLVRITVDGSMSIGLGLFILRTGDFPINIIAIYVVHVLQGYFVLLSNPSAPPTCTLFQNVQIVDILLNYLIIFFKCSFSLYWSMFVKGNHQCLFYLDESYAYIFQEMSIRRACAAPS